jgi:hypothetical protein
MAKRSGIALHLRSRGDKTTRMRDLQSRLSVPLHEDRNCAACGLLSAVLSRVHNAEKRQRRAVIAVNKSSSSLSQNDENNAAFSPLVSQPQRQMESRHAIQLWESQVPETSERQHVLGQEHQ